MITTAWKLGGGGLGPVPGRYCKWAHMLGYGGHFLTKSRHYSVTLGQLRNARTEHRRARHVDADTIGTALDDTRIIWSPPTWTYAGRGHVSTLAAELALAAAARAREHR